MKYGARFFMPAEYVMYKFCQKKKYIYDREFGEISSLEDLPESLERVDLEDITDLKHGVMDCAICMINLKHTEDGRPLKTYFETPCKHRFH